MSLAEIIQEMILRPSEIGETYIVRDPTGNVVYWEEDGTVKIPASNTSFASDYSNFEFQVIRNGKVIDSQPIVTSPRIDSPSVITHTGKPITSAYLDYNQDLSPPPKKLAMNDIYTKLNNMGINKGCGCSKKH